MPDLGSQTLDTLFGLAFVFLLLSTVASGITEGIAWLLRRRAADLERGVRRLLADDDTANAVLDHPLIKNLAPGQRRIRPSRKTQSYLSSRDFALALLDTLAPPAPGTAGSRNVLEEVRGAINSASSPLPADLKRQLGALLDEAGEDIGQLRGSIERWFDDAMARVSGWYKRWSQLVICGVALLVTLAFNVDAVRVADRLWNDEAVRASVSAAATAAVDQQTSSAGGSTDEAAADAEASGQAAEDAANQLDALELPVGWSDANDDWRWSMLTGWLITFVAVSLGAPFWFDALGRLARLRTTGVKPSATQGTRTAS